MLNGTVLNVLNVVSIYGHNFFHAFILIFKGYVQYIFMTIIPIFQVERNTSMIIFKNCWVIFRRHWVMLSSLRWIIPEGTERECMSQLIYSGCLSSKRRIRKLCSTSGIKVIAKTKGLHVIFLDHVKEYPTMHYIGIPSQAQSIIQQGFDWIF